MTENEKLDLLLQKVDGIGKKVDGIEKKVDGIEKKVDGIEKKVNGLENKVDGLEKKVTMIQLDVENEVKPNIMRVAEGHLDLSRKLNENIKLSSDIQAQLESYDLVMKHHDNEISKLKIVK